MIDFGISDAGSIHTIDVYGQYSKLANIQEPIYLANPRASTLESLEPTDSFVAQNPIKRVKRYSSSLRGYPYTCSFTELGEAAGGWWQAEAITKDVNNSDADSWFVKQV